MAREFLTLPTVRRALPLRRNVQCVAFAATAALVTTMLAQGIRVRLNTLDTWHYVAPLSDIGPDRLWELLQDSRFKYIAVVTFLVSPTGSNQTFNIPSSWNNLNNKVECIGGGASGGAQSGPTFDNCATGGGGGAYAAVSPLILTPGGTATYQIAATVAGVTNASNGNIGNDTWFNGASFGVSSVGAKGGSAGQHSASSGSASGASGGLASASIGTTKFNGGNSGSASASGQESASGAGGAAGPNGAGNNSTASTNANSTAGGSGDAGSGGSGGSPASGTGAGAGGNGTEYDASHGCGGGGGADRSDGDTTHSNAGAGGNYGGGGGGAASGGNSTSATSGGGAQGLIVVTNVTATIAIFSGVIG